MPELPEVETIARSLAPHVTGRTVVAVVVHDRRLRQPVVADFERRLVGRRVAAIDRAGKALVLHVDASETLLVQLGMTGRLTLRPEGAASRPHDHVSMALDDGRSLIFNDVRRFGWLRLVSPDEVPWLVGGGVDPLRGDLTGARLFERSRATRVHVKSLLMDQRVVLGIGNIYASEILFHAAVRPSRRAHRLTRADCERIVTATRVVLEEAIRCGGSSISDYRDGFDRFGSYQERHHVYARVAHPCRRCAGPIAMTRLAGRSSFYCPRCQR